MRGFTCCREHLNGRERDAADAERELRYLSLLSRETNRVVRERAKLGLSAIAKRRLHRLWQIDPRRPDRSTLTLDEPTERAVRAWLREAGVELDKPLPETGRKPTPRCRDRLRWTAYRALRRDGSAPGGFDRSAAFRVAAARRDDMRFFLKLARIGGDEDV